MVETLSRIQFATVAIFHFLFVPLTLGLSVLVADHGDAATRGRGDETYLKMTRYWSRLFLVNFAVGVVTGHHAGVPVRHELGGVLEVRRRHLRRAACHRGHRGLLPGVHVHRAVGVQLEARFAGRACRHHVGRGVREHPLRAVDPAGQRVDAEAARLRPGRRAGRSSSTSAP